MNCKAATKLEMVRTGLDNREQMEITRTGCGEQISDGFELPKDRGHWKKWKFCPFCGLKFEAPQQGERHEY